jgi:hypothetical protein
LSAIVPQDPTPLPRHETKLVSVKMAVSTFQKMSIADPYRGDFVSLKQHWATTIWGDEQSMAPPSPT